MNFESKPNESVETSSAAGRRARFLRANSDAYGRLVQRIPASSTTSTDQELLGVALAARAASEFHPGRFADGLIENRALAIGAGLPEMPLVDANAASQSSRKGQPSRKGRRRVLHVATQVNSIGGHTRMLFHWAHRDPDSINSLAVTDQQDIPVPGWLSQTLSSSGGSCHVAPANFGLAEKGIWLRQLARETADLIVLHHDPSDVVPTVAFAPAGGPPVARLNIADHQFWLGGTVSDVVISLRSAGSDHAKERRFVTSTAVMPIPLEDPERTVTREEARASLGIPEDRVALLSVGRAEKYRPCSGHDFVGTMSKILDRHPQAHLFVVGVTPDGIQPHLKGPIHARMHFVGPVENPTVYRAAADLYLESFPFGSQTALLEAALCALPVVPANAPLFPLLVANDDALLHLIPNPATEEEYLARVSSLIENSELRAQLGRSLREALLVDHIGEGWTNRLRDIYQRTDQLVHMPHRLPEAECVFAPEDVNLSYWHAAADGKTYSSFDESDNVSVYAHSAFVAKYLSDYGTARKFAWLALWQNPLRKQSWRLMFVSVLGRLGEILRERKLSKRLPLRLSGQSA